MGLRPLWRHRWWLSTPKDVGEFFPHAPKRGFKNRPLAPKGTERRAAPLGDILSPAGLSGLASPGAVPGSAKLAPPASAQTHTLLRPFSSSVGAAISGVAAHPSAWLEEHSRTT